MKHEISTWQQEENLRLLKQCTKNRVMKTIKHEVISTWQQEEDTKTLEILHWTQIVKGENQN